MPSKTAYFRESYMRHVELEKIINAELQTHLFRDYAPIGLQVEGRERIQKIVTGVTACQKLIDAAIEMNADAILVHHGYFWKNEESEIVGIKRRRLKSLLENDINLFAYHLPLDGHPFLGNNAQLAPLFGISPQIPQDITDLLWKGEFTLPIAGFELRERIEHVLGHAVLHSDENAPMLIKRIAWCSGGGQDYIERAARENMDAFISGEVSEKTIHIAREYGIHFFAAGHHATERYGIKALGEWLAKNYSLDVIFIDIDNPA